MARHPTLGTLAVAIPKLRKGQLVSSSEVRRGFVRRSRAGYDLNYRLDDRFGF